MLLGGAFLLVIGIVVAYYYTHANTPQFHPAGHGVSYAMVEVDGPIQPIPNIKTIDPEWVALGKDLFISPLLSKDGSVSCASCHDLSGGGDDGLAVSVGVGKALGHRNAPSVLNAVFNFRQFWDGRSHDLADQAPGPIHNPLEMDSSWPEIIEKLSSNDYFVTRFKRISQNGITRANIVKAITIFEQSLVTPNAPIDRYILGDKNALSVAQKRGLKKFIDYGCITCHQGRNIGGNLFQKIGRLDGVPKHLLEDKGRFLITDNPYDEHVFKVPSLRNIALTSPYFHDGSVDELSQAIRIMAKGQLGLDLDTADVSDLQEILMAFTGDTPSSLR